MSLPMVYVNCIMLCVLVVHTENGTEVYAIAG